MLLPSTGRDHGMISKDFLLEKTHQSHPYEENVFSPPFTVFTGHNTDLDANSLQ